MMYEDEPINEYRIKVTVRNNLILNAIENAGHKNVSAFCRSVDLPKTALTDLISMKKPPITKDGEFSTLAKLLMEELCLLPTDLWTSEQLTLKIRRNTAQRSVSADGMRAALGMNAEEMLGLMKPDDLEEVVLKHEMVSVIEEQLASLSPRESKVLHMRYGIGCEEHTYEEIGIKFALTRERIRQIEAKALRKLKHPSIVEELRQLLPEYEKPVKLKRNLNVWRTCKHEFMQGLTNNRMLKCPYCGTTDDHFYYCLNRLSKLDQALVREATGIHLPKKENYEQSNI
jgi:RNA polymerase sigma factor (sigma-70 family)